MNELSYREVLRLAAPETILTIAALGVLFVDLVGMRGVSSVARRRMAVAITGVGCLAALLWTALVPTAGVLGTGLFVVDPLTQGVKAVLLVLTALTALIAADAAFTDHIGEFFALLLLATIGMMCLVATEHLLFVFLALEMTSVSLYVLTAFNKRHPRAAEAALKYFLFGGVAAAFALFGFSLLYGLTGSVELREIASTLQGRPMDPLLAVALVMVLVGFGYKIAAVPFHLWAPDAYQGAPAPSAALIAAGSKVASFFLLAKVMWLGFAGVEGSAAWHAFGPGWMPLLATVAALSMLLGNLAALVQSSVKRLLAYSAIAHGGYALLGVIGVGSDGMAALVYYVAIYGLTTVGAFGVVAMLEGAKGDVTLDDLRGLARRAPVPALALLVFMLSLAGIPPLAGFFGKFYLFVAALKGDAPHLGNLWLVVLAIATSALSLYYYLQVLKRVFVHEPADETPPLAGTPIAHVGVSVAALGVIVLGCLPGLLLGPLATALTAVGLAR